MIVKSIQAADSSIFEGRKALLSKIFENIENRTIFLLSSPTPITINKLTYLASTLTTCPLTPPSLLLSLLSHTPASSSMLTLTACLCSPYLSSLQVGVEGEYSASFSSFLQEYRVAASATISPPFFIEKLEILMISQTELFEKQREISMVLKGICRYARTLTFLEAQRAVSAAILPLYTHHTHTQQMQDLAILVRKLRKWIGRYAFGEFSPVGNEEFVELGKVVKEKQEMQEFVNSRFFDPEIIEMQTIDMMRKMELEEKFTNLEVRNIKSKAVLQAKALDMSIYIELRMLNLQIISVYLWLELAKVEIHADENSDLYKRGAKRAFSSVLNHLKYVTQDNIEGIKGILQLAKELNLEMESASLRQALENGLIDKE